MTPLIINATQKDDCAEVTPLNYADQCGLIRIEVVLRTFQSDQTGEIQGTNIPLNALFSTRSGLTRV